MKNRKKYFTFILGLLFLLYIPLHSDADVLVEKRAKDKKIKSEIKESIDLSSDIDRNSRDSMVTVESTTQSLALAIDYVPMMAAVCDYETENGFESCELPPIQPMHRTESNTSIDVCGSSNGIVSTGHDEISTCIVCEKKFKSKSYLKKHLRTVHTGKQCRYISHSLTELAVLFSVLFL